jgi:hypothetical protein
VLFHEEFIGFIKTSGFKDLPKKEIGTLSSLRLGLVSSTKHPINFYISFVQFVHNVQGF